MTTTSVIIPTYNRARFLDACIASTLESGVSPEVIVVDDGSTDDTAAVVRAWGSRVTYVRQSNAGPATARNTGFAISRGQYVAFLDSDDRWIPEGISALVGTLDSCPDAPLVFGDTRQGNAQDGYRSFVGTYGGVAFSQIPSTPVVPGVRRLERGAFLRQLARRNVVFLGSLVMRRSVFEQIGGFNPSLCGAADWELFLRLACEYEFVFCDRHQASIYWTHAGGMSTDEDEMVHEFVKAAASVASKPGLSQAARALLETRLEQGRFEWAYLAYDRGDILEARRRFASCLKDSGFTGRAFAYWLLSHLSPDGVHRCRALKRTLVRT